MKRPAYLAMLSQAGALPAPSIAIEERTLDFVHRLHVVETVRFMVDRVISSKNNVGPIRCSTPTRAESVDDPTTQ
jgi:hypothetical protein